MLSSKVLISAVVMILMIGWQSVMATRTGSGCDLGHTQRECYDQFLKHAPQTALYKDGFAQGVIDGHSGILNHKTLGKTVQEEILYGLGYSDGWRTTCKEQGLDAGPDSGCELTLDR
jgi:hypothetical protein